MYVTKYAHDRCQPPPTGTDPPPESCASPVTFIPPQANTDKLKQPDYYLFAPGFKTNDHKHIARNRRRYVVYPAHICGSMMATPIYWHQLTKETREAINREGLQTYTEQEPPKVILSLLSEQAQRTNNVLPTWMGESFPAPTYEDTAFEQPRVMIPHLENMTNHTNMATEIEQVNFPTKATMDAAEEQTAAHRDTNHYHDAGGRNTAFRSLEVIKPRVSAEPQQTTQNTNNTEEITSHQKQTKLYESDRIRGDVQKLHSIKANNAANKLRAAKETLQKLETTLENSTTQMTLITNATAEEPEHEMEQHDEAMDTEEYDLLVHYAEAVGSWNQLRARQPQQHNHQLQIYTPQAGPGDLLETFIDEVTLDAIQQMVERSREDGHPQNIPVVEIPDELKDRITYNGDGTTSFRGQPIYGVFRLKTQTNRTRYPSLEGGGNVLQGHTGYSFHPYVQRSGHTKTSGGRVFT